MAPVPKDTVEHALHPGHPLNKVTSTTEYLCNGCMDVGDGVRFRCDGCDFDLHEYCATCPPTLSSFMHSPHPLFQVARRKESMYLDKRSCDVCGELVGLLYYACKGCDFDVHPLCTQLPETLRLPIHPQHPLTLLSTATGFCAVCRSPCSSWRYGCDDCSFDIHLKCLVSCPSPSPPSSTTFVPTNALPPPPAYGIPRPRPAYKTRPPPFFGGYGYGAPFPSSGYLNQGISPNYTANYPDFSSTGYLNQSGSSDYGVNYPDYSSTGYFDPSGSDGSNFPDFSSIGNLNQGQQTSGRSGSSIMSLVGMLTNLALGGGGGNFGF